MSRSGYTDECDDNWALIRYRGSVKSALRGKRGQAFLREMVRALDAMPEKKLIARDLVTPTGSCCAMGAVVIARGAWADACGIDPEDAQKIAGLLAISESMVREIAFENDCDFSIDMTPETRWSSMRRWAESNIRHDDA